MNMLVFFVTASSCLRLTVTLSLSYVKSFILCEFRPSFDGPAALSTNSLVIEALGSASRMTNKLALYCNCSLISKGGSIRVNMGDGASSAMLSHLLTREICFPAASDAPRPPLQAKFPICCLSVNDLHRKQDHRLPFIPSFSPSATPRECIAFSLHLRAVFM